MEMSAIRPRTRASRHSFAGRHTPPWIVAAAAALIAIAIQSLWIPVDADVSWLLTVSERVLAGDRLYVDIVEVNPPASVWLYLPLVWLAQLIGARPEAVVVAGFAAAGVASTLATVRLASALRNAPDLAGLAAAAAFVTLLLPMALFAQREHAALILALPVLTCLALVADGRRIGRSALIASGVAAGLIVVIKPHFLAAVLVPAAWAMWKRRSIGPFVPAMAAAGATILVYAAAVLFLTPAYLDWIPVIARTYAPMHDAWWKVVVGPAFYPAIAFGLAALLRARTVPSLTWAWALGATGFFLAAVAQAKNYPNHWLPQAGLALAAAAALAFSPDATRSRRKLVAAALAAVGFCAMYQWVIRPDPAVEAAIRVATPPHPRIIALSPQLTTGHPVARNVDGRWVGSRAGLFTASGALYAGLGDPVLRRAYRSDLESFATDVRRNPPDVVLVSIAAKTWLMREPAIARTMLSYRPAAKTRETEIWVRRTPDR
jgi:hypothetical protein